MSFTTVLHRLPVLAFALAAPLDGQTPTLPSGLDVTDYENVQVVIESLDADSKKIRLTADRLRTRVELRLRQARLTPVVERPEYLYVNANVSEVAFNVSVMFNRPVIYVVGGNAQTVFATVWHKAFVGTHGRDAEYIVKAIDELLDSFLNEYLAANQPKR